MERLGTTLVWIVVLLGLLSSITQCQPTASTEANREVLADTTSTDTAQDAGANDATKPQERQPVDQGTETRVEPPMPDNNITPDATMPTDKVRRDTPTTEMIAKNERTPEQTKEETPDQPAQPPKTDMPIGIPAPSFGLKETIQMYAGQMGYQTSPAGPYTHYVDNTDPNCTNKQTNGTVAKPLCDLFLGGRTTTLPAGSVVLIAGGPYAYDGWRRLIANGTAQRPVFVRGIDNAKRPRITATTNSSHDLRIQGSYLILEQLEYYNKAHIRSENEPHHIAYRSLEIHNPPNDTVGFGSALSWAGNDIVVSRCHIHHNRRLRNGKIDDLHGITIGPGSRRAWILDNHIHHNSGDSFQACHLCRNYPQYVYIGRNRFHDDRENGVDLKTIHDVVVSENLMYGYKSSSTSSGDAVVIGSNGFENGIGPTKVWFIANTIRDSATGIRVEGAGMAHLIGNVIYNVNRGIQLDKNATKLDIINNTIANAKEGFTHTWRCNFPDISIVNNIFFNISTRHLRMQSCIAKNAEISHNLFWNPSGDISASTGNRPVYTGKDSKALQAFLAQQFKASSSGNVIGDPAFTGATDFRLKMGSAARDKGTTSPSYAAYQNAYKRDIRFDLTGTKRPQGNAWDIGAHEYK